MYTGWIKNPSPAWPDSVITTNLASFNAYVMIALYVSSGVLRAVQADETGANPVTIDSLVSLSDGGWHFFAVWFDDADKKLRLSVDLETAVASAAMTGNYKTYPGASNLYIGSATGTTDAWDGNIARVGYYSTAGSDEVRTSLYNSGRGKSYSDLTTAEKVGLVSYWNLDEASGNRADSHGSNTLTDNNTVTSATNGYPANLPGRVASFVAANSEYLSLSSGIAELDDQFTLAGWVYQGAYVAEAGVFNNGPNTDFGVRVTMNVVGNGDILVRLPTDATNSANIYGYTASGLVPTGQWVHVVITYDGTDATAANRLHVYTDGVDRSLTRNGTHPSAVRVGGSFAIGQGGATNFVTGRYSVFAVWDYTKDADGVAALYNSGNGAPLP